ncbi:MAG: tRNA uridine-5-carboxymethylaminomethyl(34) synthesis GTPase MnmE [Burkholderiales bacterium]|nr:tRNA uridine-5-carboxymethylaminomethyl(34) synthesis GTPase MnmE [Burkholderiales bacterium]
MSNDDTIAAVATAPGYAGIGIVRVSGKNIESLILAVLGRQIAPRRASLGKFLDAQGDALDLGIALYYPRPNSYTGEEVLELQGHGGPALLRLVLQRCLDCGARLAEPGEFTLRAFLNSKLDLAQAEAVADVIYAGSSSAARSAMRSLQGDFSEAVEALRRKLVELRMLLEATLDFPEEGVDFLEQINGHAQLEGLNAQLERVFLASQQGSILRDGINIALVGKPNVGKSSLLNKLAGRDVAIVTDIPGTTRDLVQQSIEIAGIPVQLVDTAGLRETFDPIEVLGVSRAWVAARQADIVLLIGEDVDDLLLLRASAAKLRGQKHIFVINKIDLHSTPPALVTIGDEMHIYLSAKTGEGIDLLHRAVLSAINWNPGSEGVFIARERQLRALTEARLCMRRAVDVWGSVELVAEELRLAQDHLASITGKFAADDLLGEIFSRFCIGK